MDLEYSIFNQILVSEISLLKKYQSHKIYLAAESLKKFSRHDECGKNFNLQYTPCPERVQWVSEVQEMIYKIIRHMCETKQVVTLKS